MKSLILRFVIMLLVLAACKSGGSSKVTNSSSKTDTTPPNVSVSSNNTSNPTTAATIAMTVTFSESVSGFSSSGINVTNGSISSFGGSGSTYTFIFTPTINTTGTLRVDIAANAARDAAGNNSLAATQYTKSYYRKTPTISGTSPSNGNQPVLIVGNIIANSGTGLSANIYRDSSCTTSMGTAVSTGTATNVTSNLINTNQTYYADLKDSLGNKSACSSVLGMAYSASTTPSSPGYNPNGGLGGGVGGNPSTDEANRSIVAVYIDDPLCQDRCRLLVF